MPVVHVDVPESCQGCASCCNLDVILQPEDVAVVPRHLTRTMRANERESYTGPFDTGLIMRKADSGDCIALDAATRTCTIYDQRPEVCRWFERGGTGCTAALIRAGKTSPVAVAP